MMATWNTRRLLRLQGSPIDRLVRFEDRGTQDRQRMIVPHVASTSEGGLHWRPLAIKTAATFPRRVPSDPIVWPIWRFPVSDLDFEIRLDLGTRLSVQNRDLDFGDPAASRRARDHAAIWLEHTAADGEILRWATDDPVEFANVSMRQNTIRYTEAKRNEVKRVLDARGRGRRQLTVIIDTRRLWETEWIREP